MKFLQHLLSSSILLMSVLLSFHAVEAKPSPFYWEFMNVEIDVQDNGDMLVTETQKYVFTAAHTNERYRYIPLNRLDRIDNVEVFEGNKELSVSTETKNGQLWIKWRHTLNPPESHTFILKYRVRGSLRIRGTEDLVDWIAIFKKRSAPINKGTVTVRLPDSLAGHIRNFKSFGRIANDRQVDDRTVKFTLQDALPPGEVLEVQVAFSHGILAVSTPKWQQAPANKPAGASPTEKIIILIVTIPSILIGFILAIRYRILNGDWGEGGGG